MRAMAIRSFKMVSFISLLIIIGLSPICSFAGPHSPAQSFGSTQTIKSASDDGVVESYCESSGAGSIINLEGYCMANKITTEDGCVKMVRDNRGNGNNTYAKNIEEE